MRLAVVAALSLLAGVALGQSNEPSSLTIRNSHGDSFTFSVQERSDENTPANALVITSNVRDGEHPRTVRAVVNTWGRMGAGPLLFTR